MIHTKLFYLNYKNKKMKKLLLLALMLIGSVNILTHTYAADELDELDSLWLDEVTDGTGSNTDSNNQEVEKVKIEKTSVTSNEIDLLLSKDGDYTSYKVYYGKDGSDLSEKEVNIDGEGTTGVVLDNLEANTTYTITAKAFDEEGNPVEGTTSDPLTVTTKEAEQTTTEQNQHAAPSDNVIYNPTIKTTSGSIVVTYKPGADVKKVQISMSEDGKTFKPVAVVDSSVTKYTIKTTKAGEKFIKLVPVADDGTLWVCKIGTTDVKFIKTNVGPKAPVKKIGKAKTGPELYLLVIFAVFAYVIYARRKLKA